MKRNSLFTKIAALMLCVMMVIGCLPMSAFADWEGEILVEPTYKDLTIGDNELTVYTGMATTVYDWTATEEGTLSITMPNYIGWSYTLKNVTTNSSVSSDTVIDPEIEDDRINANPSIYVKAGDVVTLTVETNGQTKPVTCNIVASFEQAKGIAANPYEVNIDYFYNYFPVAAEQTAYFIITSDDPNYGGTTEFQGNMIISAYSEFSGYCGMQPITPVVDEYGQYVATVPVQYRAGMMLTQFTITAGAEEIGVNIRFEVPVGTNSNPADMAVGTAEEPGVNTSTSEYWFRYYAGENGTVTIAMVGDTWAYIAEHVNTNDIAVNTGTIYSDTADAQSTLVYEVVAGEVINVMLMPYDAESATFNAWFEAEAEEPEETDPPVETVPVAMIGETGYATVAEALNAATSGQTVTMIANSGTKEAPEGTLVIKPDVALDIGNNTLYASYVVGLSDGQLFGGYYQNENTHGKLYVADENISLDCDPVAYIDPKTGNPNGYYIMPVWTGSYYTFYTTRYLGGYPDLRDKGDGLSEFAFAFQNNGAANTAFFSDANTYGNNDLTITVNVSFVDKAGIKTTVTYLFPENLIKDGTAKKELTLTLAGCDTYSNLSFEVVMNSGTGVSYSGGVINYNA